MTSRNGIIRGYKITLKRTDARPGVTQIINGNGTEMFVASGLKKFTKYSVQILAFTIRDGPLSSQQFVTTEQDGKLS